MRGIKIYLSGAMSNVSLKEQSAWRKFIKDNILLLCHNEHISFFDPPEYYNFEVERHKSEKEIFEFDLYNLRNSDIVIVNFNNPESIGTAMELILAKEYKIPIIGINCDAKKLHPWLTECVTRMCDNFDEAIEHIIEFYIN